MAYYYIDKNGIEHSDENNYNLAIIQGKLSELAFMKRDFLQVNQLPNDVFMLDDYQPIAPRYENLKIAGFEDFYVLVLTNILEDELNGEVNDIENRLRTLNIIIQGQRLTIFIEDDNDIIRRLNEKIKHSIETTYEWLAQLIILISRDYIGEMNVEKTQINLLNQEVKQSTGKHTIEKMTVMERNLILIQFTINSQSKALNDFALNNEFFKEIPRDMAYDMKWLTTKADEFSDLNYEILSRLSNEFSSHMGRNLNELMKWLNSVAIVISVASMLFGLWGINTGGLFFKNHDYGFIMVIIIAIVICTVVAIYLKNHDQN